jgi:hypothetical protein
MFLDSPAQIFWTPYDPLDLASTSLDPLGFARGYLALADRFLPAFTTVTGIPRYVSMLCAAVAAAQERGPREAALPSRLRQERLRLVKSFERAWALACALAAQDPAIGSQAVQGLRGVRSVNRRLTSLPDRARSVQTNSYNLLANQVRYGGLGVYSTFLEECHLASMRVLTLRPLGEQIAAAFPPPRHGLAVHDEEVKLPLEELKEWGTRAHVSKFTEAEAGPLAEALRGGEEADHADHVRWTALRLLASFQEQDTSDETALLQQLANQLRNGGFERMKAPRECLNQITAILHVLEPFERFYQGVVFLFEVLRASATDAGQAPLAELADREDVQEAAGALKDSVSRLHQSLAEAQAISPAAVGEVALVLQDSRIFILADATRNQADERTELLRTVIRRHEEVQSRKFDRGLPKGAWLRVASGRVQLTAQLHQLVPGQRPVVWTDTPRHPYRTPGAFAFIRACGIR